MPSPTATIQSFTPPPSLGCQFINSSPYLRSFVPNIIASVGSSTAQADLNKGHDALLANDLQKALMLFKKVSLTRRGKYAGLVGEGLTRIQLGQLEEAKQIFKHFDKELYGTD